MNETANATQPGETMFVVPESGRRVLDPATRQALPADGADVPRSTFWLRRLREGDVKEAASAASLPRGPRLDPIDESSRSRARATSNSNKTEK